MTTGDPGSGLDTDDMEIDHGPTSLDTALAHTKTKNTNSPDPNVTPARATPQQLPNLNILHSI